MHYLLYLIGAGQLLIGLVGFGVEIDKMMSGTSEHPVLGFVLATGLTVGGIVVLRAGKQRARRRLELQAQEQERSLLQLARKHGGMLTPALVAADTDLSVAEADAELLRLAKLGACEVEYGEQTAVEYRFAGLGDADR